MKKLVKSIEDAQHEVDLAPDPETIKVIVHWGCVAAQPDIVIYTPLAIWQPAVTKRVTPLF